MEPSLDQKWWPRGIAMINYWIFTVKNDKIGTMKKKGIEIYRQRMHDSFWGLGEKTANRIYLEPGDKVVFYLAGTDGHKFLGTCILDSEYYELSEEEKRKLWHGPFFRSAHGVRLKGVRIWESPKPIGPLIGKLRFIENPGVWGTYLQGSIRRIPEDDYSSIVQPDEEAQALKEILEQSGAEKPRLTDESPNIEIKRKARAVAFREKVREIYNYSCAVCGKKRFSRLNHPEVESSHIFPKEKNGSDDLRNGIALCRFHHWAFDEGLFSIRDDHSIIVESRIRNDKNYDEISRFRNQKIVPPKDERYTPHPMFLTQHRKMHGFE